MKICSRCHIEKPLSGFNKNKKEKDGYQHYCRECQKIYHWANKEKHNAHGKIYYEANREKLIAQKREYCKENKEKIAIRDKKYYEANKERKYAYNREYYEANKEEITVQVKKYGEANKEKKTEYNKIYYRENKERLAGYNKQWYENNPEKIAQKGIIRRTTIREQCPDWADREAINDIYLEARRLTKETGIQYHVDHIVPLKGEYISGLHVENNLQIITAQENRRKRNNFELGG